MESSTPKKRSSQQQPPIFSRIGSGRIFWKTYGPKDWKTWWIGRGWLGMAKCGRLHGESTASPGSRWKEPSGSRKRRNWSAAQTSGPAVGLLRSHTFFQPFLWIVGLLQKESIQFVWFLFSLPALLLSGENSCAFIADRGLLSTSLVQAFSLCSFGYLRIGSKKEDTVLFRQPLRILYQLC